MSGLIESIVKASLRNRAVVLFLVFMLVAAGAVTVKNTLIEAYPDVTDTRVRIISQWPGRSAEEIEKFVTLPITKEMNTIPGKTDVRSISLFGLSVVTVNFGEDITDFHAQQYASNRMRNVELPSGAEADIEPPSGATGEIFRYVVRGKNKEIREIFAVQQWVIERELLSVPGVADIVSFGGEEKSYEITVNPVELANYNLTALDVFEAVGKSNINVGGDAIFKGGQAYVVRGIGLLEKISDIENILIENVGNTPVLVKNVASVKAVGKPRLGQVGLNDDNDLVQGIVIMLRGQNPNEVVQRLNERIADLNSRILPADIRVEPFLDRTMLVDKTIGTVTKNLIEGILLVSIVVFVFLYNWRTTVIVASVIPLAFLFALIMLRFQGLSANLISIGAVDFGLLLEGTLVIVEHVFVGLDRRAKEMGMPAFNRSSKDDLIGERAKSVGKSILFAQIILIVALLPIFTFQKVEGKMFSPLAFTLGYALLGSLVLSLTYVPVMCKLLLDKNVVDRHSPLTEWFIDGIYRMFAFAARHRRATIGLFIVLLALSLSGFTKVGTEFIPKLNEGSIYIRATLPNSINLDESVRLADEMRTKIKRFEPVSFVLTQTGRPNDGTEPTGFFNIEFHVQLKDPGEWAADISKDELLQQMQDTLNVYPGTVFGFSQPIMDNVEEYVAGVKSSLVAKIYGDDLQTLEETADSVARVIRDVQGIEDVNIFRNIGVPELRIGLSEQKMARYGVTMADAQAVVEMAIGGKAVSTFYENERMFDIRIRYEEQYRNSEDAIRNILVPAAGKAKVPLSEIATIGYHTGPAFIYRQGSSRYIAVGFSIRGRDLGGTIAEAQKKVAERVTLPPSYRLEWAGEFESQQRAMARLTFIVPVALMLIGFLLYLNFGNMKDTLLSLITVPFAFIGGFLSLFVTQTIFGISAGIGFIILFGVGTIDGIILISVMKDYLAKGKKLKDAIAGGVKERIRPVFMIAVMGSVGLLPAALSSGIGSEIQKPLAIMIVGGLVVCMVLSLLVLPQIFYFAYRKQYGDGE